MMCGCRDCICFVTLFFQLYNVCISVPSPPPLVLFFCFIFSFFVCKWYKRDALVGVDGRVQQHVRPQHKVVALPRLALVVVDQQFAVVQRRGDVIAELPKKKKKKKKKKK